LLGTMYELPSLKNVKQVVLDENAVLGKGVPLLIYADDEAQESPSGNKKSDVPKLKDAAA